MNIRKMSQVTLLSSLFTVMSFSAWAACGDSECWLEEEQFVCEVETETGTGRCTQDNPCEVKCP